MGPLSRLKRMLIRKKKKEQKAREKAASEPTVSPVKVPANTSTRTPSNDVLLDFYGIIQAPLNPRDTGKRRPTDLELRLLIISATIEVASIVREASQASSVLSPISTFCRVVENVLELASARISNEMILESLIQRLKAHLQLARAEEQEIHARERKGDIYAPNPAFLDAVQAYIKTLDVIKTRVAEHQRAAFNDPDNQHPSIGLNLEGELDAHFGMFMRSVQNCILEATLQLADLTADARLSQLLKGSVDARGDRVKPLTPGTRVALIERLSAWARSSDNVEQIFWLRDKAGTGKSTLAAHMAKKWHTEGILAARWFFDQNGGRNSRRVERFCASIARELSEYYPPAKGIILEAIERISGHASGSFHEVLCSLLTSVVGRISEHIDRPLIFVIDALDECIDEDAQLLLTTLLSGPLSPKKARFFVTSRPTKELGEILDGTTKVGGNGVALLDVKSGDSVRDHDISIYVRHTLARFSVAEQDLVIECAKGMFLWATLACETLERTVSPTTLLRKLQSNTPDRHISSLYETVLESALPPNHSPQDLQLLRSVLQGVTLTCTPVSIFSVQSFFPAQRNAKVEGQEYVEFFVKKLGSIMKDGTPYLPIYLLHPTFGEFIEDQKQGAMFYVSPPAGHSRIAMACLDLLEDLTWNTLGLADPDSPLPIWPPLEGFEFSIPKPAWLSSDTEAPLRYAITFWVTHAALALGEDEALRERLQRFFESSFLVWLEWSSALEALSEAIDGLRLLSQSVKVQFALDTSKTSDSMVQWCTDSLKFLQRNSHTIGRCGLQVWMSALVFTPNKSLVYQTFSRAPIRPLPEVLTHQPDAFDSHRVLYDVGQHAYLADISPDGKRILTHEGASVRLWNMKPFRLIRQFIYKQNYGTPEAIFSADGSIIASGGAHDAEIHIWNGHSGAPLGEEGQLLPRLHSGMLIGLVFALSDSVVVSIAQDGRIVRWTVTPGPKGRSRRGRVFGGNIHSGSMTRIVASPDGKLVATFSIDQTIRLWDPERMEGFGVAMVGNAGARTGKFSTDGTKLVAGYDDGEVIIWDVVTQAPLHRLERDGDTIYSVAVSPDGATVACGNNRLCLWDINTGKLLCPPLAGHTGGVSRLTFDREGNRLVSGSRDRTVRVWDIHQTEGKLNVDGFTLRGHAGSVQGVALSADGRQVISSSADGTLRLWDIDLRDSADSNDPIEFTHDDVDHLKFSRDGSRLLTVGKNGTFQLWDPVTGSKLGELVPSPHGEVRRVLSSFNPELWASLHVDGHVCLWKYRRESLNPAVYTLSCRQVFITCMEFAPDDSFIALGGRDRSVQLWDVASCSYSAALDCSSNPGRIAIRQDAKVIATYTEDQNICLWDIETCQIIAGPEPVPMDNKSSWENEAHQMGFSPDEKTLAVLFSGELRLFDIEGHVRCFLSVLPSHSNGELHPAPVFSADGRYLFYNLHITEVATLPRDQFRTSWPRQAEEARALNPTSPLFVGYWQRQVASMRTGDLLILPSDLWVEKWAAYQNILAMGTTDGRVVILRLPKESI